MAVLWPVIISDFVTNSYGESWDSSREQIVSPSPEPSSPSSKNYKSEIENAWAFMLPDRYKILFCIR